MELHQLKYFVAVAELGSFTRAAERCLVSQPSLSQQVATLEKNLGRMLIERLGRTVRLTDVGRALYPQAVAVLAAAEEARRRVEEAGDPASGRFAVGAIPTVAPYLLPPLLKAFRKRFPRAEVTVQEDLTAGTVAACLAGELDVGIVALPIPHDHLHVEPLASEDLLLALPAGHPFLRKRAVTLEDVSGEPFVLLSEMHCLGEYVVSFCKQQGCQPVVRCRGAQLLTVQELVARGHGVSLVPAMACDADRGRRCRYRRLSASRPARTLALIWHRHRGRSRLVLSFLEMIRDYVRSEKRFEPAAEC
jgi:LysR family hydrogen peroxide-inducible transcriptional activator